MDPYLIGVVGKHIPLQDEDEYAIVERLQSIVPVPMPTDTVRKGFKSPEVCHQVTQTVVCRFYPKPQRE